MRHNESMNTQELERALWKRYWNHEIDFSELLMHLYNLRMYLENRKDYA